MSNIIYGRNSVNEALDLGRVIKLYVLGSYPKLETIKQKKIPVVIKNRQEMDRLCHKGNHQGIAAEIEDYPLYRIEDLIKAQNGLIVILDGIEDPHNFGAIMRTADCAGADGIIYRDKHGVGLTPTVAKVSCGAIEHVKVAAVNNLVNAINLLKKQGYWIVGTDACGTDRYNEIDYKMNVALVIGSEGKGMSRLTKEACDYIVSLPMKGHVNSLNASNAAAIMLYKIIENRQ